MILDETALYTYMQQCVDLIPQSEHETSKVAALLVQGEQSYGAVNNISERLKPYIVTLPTEKPRIGDASPGPHAETAAGFGAPFAVEGADLYVTDPPCPNCAKNIPSMGIKRVFVDHKGFTKSFFQRRMRDFKVLSLPIFTHGGVQVFELIRNKSEKTASAKEMTENVSTTNPFQDRPVFIEKLDDVPSIDSFHDMAIAIFKTYPSTQSYAAAIARDQTGAFHFMAARPACALGYHHDTGEFPAHDKYSIKMQPLNRLLMECAQRGFDIMPGYQFSARTPTSRELVDNVSAGMRALSIYHPDESRDPMGQKALAQLQEAGALSVTILENS